MSWFGSKDAKRQKGSKKAAKTANPLLSFAEAVRDHKEFESRWAVLQEARVEYFRAKDLVSLIAKHPELVEILTSSNVVLKSPVEESIALMMLNQRLILRCDRVNKTIRPGKKKLSRWPAKLELHSENTFTVDDGFYAWTFERRRPLWQTILSVLLPFFTVACCLFPVFPYWAKLSVLYLSLTLLTAMLGLLFVRWVVFGTIWILVGKRVWFFPNILADEVVSLTELFKFMPEKDEEPPVKLLTRFVVTLLTVGIVYFSVQNAPDENARARYGKKVVNIIDEVIAWSPAMLVGNVTAEANVTEAAASPPVNVSAEVNETAKIEEIFAKAADLVLDLGDDADIDFDALLNDTKLATEEVADSS